METGSDMAPSVDCLRRVKRSFIGLWLSGERFGLLDMGWGVTLREVRSQRKYSNCYLKHTSPLSLPNRPCLSLDRCILLHKVSGLIKPPPRNPR
ncbi:hypothetical protein CEXT_212151 [Caerostris extrusa]|uniref:Uncharacterized protein n=1 Tax=Caerostris extrusa TaxID=172846 RepID=A0AAV4NAY2_CAEEX|nr:hypothetical protein CEXT_212151 [Caerostris extrusa]